MNLNELYHNSRCLSMASVQQFSILTSFQSSSVLLHRKRADSNVFRLVFRQKPGRCMASYLKLRIADVIPVQLSVQSICDKMESVWSNADWRIPLNGTMRKGQATCPKNMPTGTEESQ